jgi:hypothetical protein
MPSGMSIARATWQLFDIACSASMAPTEKRPKALEKLPIVEYANLQEAPRNRGICAWHGRCCQHLEETIEGKRVDLAAIRFQPVR